MRIDFQDQGKCVIIELALILTLVHLSRQNQVNKSIGAQALTSLSRLIVQFLLQINSHCCFLMLIIMIINYVLMLIWQVMVNMRYS